MTKTKFQPDKFIVINWKQYKKLDKKDQKDLNFIMAKISIDIYNSDSKNEFPKYLVCNQDEPYADKVLAVILEGEREKLNIQERRGNSDFENWKTEFTNLAIAQKRDIPTHYDEGTLFDFFESGITAAEFFDNNYA